MGLHPWQPLPSWMYERPEEYAGDWRLPDPRAEEEAARYRERLVERDENLGLDR